MPIGNQSAELLSPPLPPSVTKPSAASELGEQQLPSTEAELSPSKGDPVSSLKFGSAQKRIFHRAELVWHLTTNASRSKIPEKSTTTAVAKRGTLKARTVIGKGPNYVPKSLSRLHYFPPFLIKLFSGL
ncbi:unnamed protein product [Protopolystoma xenopodis]|uniref:Uncharacterized protein n=1 Tax=Protopolystoma xenopodis TaxID=117903 RepID=A0A448X9Z8_9PLAT|nr:unnamed protein product [Protopolystoma xenopodis]